MQFNPVVLFVEIGKGGRGVGGVGRGIGWEEGREKER